MKINSNQLLDAAIALERGDDRLAKEVFNMIVEEDEPSVLLFCWYATDRIDTTISELRVRLNATPNLKTVLKLHKFVLAEEAQYG